MARDHDLIVRAKAMRRQSTAAEERLWRLLRASRALSVTFSRQVVIGPHIVDFAARGAKLVVELDGESHDLTVQYDARRTGWLEREGYRVIRCRNADVMANAEGVVSARREALGTPPLPAARRAAVPLPASGERAG